MALQKLSPERLDTSAGIILTPASTPSAPVEGQMYYDSTSDQVQFYNGTEWGSMGITDSVTASSFNGTEIATSATNNLGVGIDALDSITTGDYNTAIGDYTLTTNTNGTGNAAIGYNALRLTNGGSNNTAMGHEALWTNVGGNDNLAIGKTALRQNSGGHYNVGIGSESLYYTTGSNNTAIGREAGKNITSGDNNIIIGASIAADSATGSNQLNIGGAIKGDLSTNAITFTGDVLPAADNSKDLGSASKRWQNIYTTDLHLANERGNWTVIEEENYLTLRNNKTDKVYKLVMEEIE